MLKHNFSYINTNLNILKNIFFLFLGWRVILVFITFLGLGAIPNLHFYSRELFFPSPELDYWTRWANWDGKAYQDIANFGYQPVLTVFFPAFPIVIKILTYSGLSSFWAGIFLSNIFTILAMFFLFKLIRLDFNDNVSKRAVFALIIFPTSFYLVALYNDSLALFTTIAAFYFARQKNWMLASVFASISALTRIIGIAAIIGVITEYLVNYELFSNTKIRFSFFWQTKIRRLCLCLIFFILSLNFLSYLGIPKDNFLIRGIVSFVIDLCKWVLYPVLFILLIDYAGLFLKFIKIKNIFSKNFLYILASITPLSLYLLYLKINFQSFLSFLSHESVWGKYLSFPWSGPLNNLQFLSSNLFTISEYSSRVHLRFGVFLLALACLIISFRKLRLSYSIFYLIAFLVPLFSGTLIDFPRYSLVFFPLFIVLGLLKNEMVQKMGAMIFISLLAFLSILFFNSYFFM